MQLGSVNSILLVLLFSPVLLVGRWINSGATVSCFPLHTGMIDDYQSDRLGNTLWDFNHSLSYEELGKLQCRLAEHLGMIHNIPLNFSSSKDYIFSRGIEVLGDAESIP